MEKFRLKNGQEVTIRFAEAKDYEAYCVFYEKIAEETVFTNQYVGRPRRSKEAFEAQLHAENIYRLVVTDKDEQIVGVCTVVVERPEHPWLNKSCDFGIMLLKAYTGQGLGKYLMKKMEDWARSQKMHRIGAQVRTKNIAAMALYLKCGFEVEGIARDAAYINGEWHNQYYIGKILD
jgi:RimJ/RimL family protein N-acetyltransferase